MLFGNDYYVKGTVITNKGRTINFKGEYKARFMNEKEIIAAVQEEFKRNLWYETGETVVQFTNMEVR